MVLKSELWKNMGKKWLSNSHRLQYFQLVKGHFVIVIGRFFVLRYTFFSEINRKLFKSDFIAVTGLILINDPDSVFLAICDQ